MLPINSIGKRGTGCVQVRIPITVIFKRIDTINAGRDSAFMSFDYLAQLNANPILPYESGKWTIVSGTGDFYDDTRNNTEVRNISVGLNTYKWTVTNGPCKREDLINFEVSSAIVPEEFRQMAMG